MDSELHKIWSIDYIVRMDHRSSMQGATRLLVVDPYVHVVQRDTVDGPGQRPESCTVLRARCSDSSWLQ